jgi:hypothetical protein
MCYIDGQKNIYSIRSYIFRTSLDKILTWQKHIKAKRRQLELKIRNMNWLTNKKSQLSLENKIIIYKAIIKPVWIYGIELWRCSKPSNPKILQTFQSKTLN